MTTKVEISTKTIVFSILFLLSLWLVFITRDIILQFFVALIIMASFNPIVTKMTKGGIPRSAAVFLVYLVVFGFFGVIIYALIPVLVEQTTSFVSNFPRFLDDLGVPKFVSEQILSQVLSQVGSLPSKVAKTALSVFSNIIGVFSVMVFSFYLLISRDKLNNQLGIFFGENKRKELGDLIDRLELKLGGWARGELALMFLVGLANFVGLTLLSIPFALPLALLAGLLELVPIIGPVIAAVPAIIIGFGISSITGVATAALAFLIQQVENYVFVPKIMQKSAGLNPIATLLSLAVGIRLAGILGALLSVPVVITLQILAKEYLLDRS